jgi:beta-galactosidase
MIHGMNLDWKRFITDQTIDFMMDEAAPLKEITPDVPITTNLMGFYPGLNYWKFAPHMDVISWDNYPTWHGEIEDWKLAARISMIHDLNRSLKGGKPFMLMESTPSATNWQPISKLKKPGMHILSSIQAVAHGSDTVQYFQWRKSRGASEKFHGAVVDHCGHENTRVFREVADLGMVLEKLDPIIGSTVRPEAAVIFDWENRWAMEDAQGPRNKGLYYEETVLSHYRVLWKRGIPTDVINMDCDFSSYKLIIAPMLYMLRPGVAERVEKFMEAGGTFVTTYWSGIVNENDLCFLGGFPGPLRKVMGIWSEEIDSLYDNEQNSITFTGDSGFNSKQEYSSNTLCDLIHAETAQVLAVYQKDFYKGRPALTVNSFGKGKAYYIATRTEDDFNDAFYEKVIRDSGIKQVINAKLPEGVTVQLRGNGAEEIIFVMNFTDKPQTVELGERKYTDMLNSSDVGSNLELPPFGVRILQRI